MSFAREPRLHPVPVADLRPTQITVGMREVDAKRKHWRLHPDRKKADFLGRHMIPVVWGPKEEFYVIDSANFFGPISCVDASNAAWSSKTSAKRSNAL